MSVQSFLRLLRARWLIIVVVTIIAIGGAAAINFFTTPLYEASTRLFVSTTSGASPSEAYQGTLFSQQRVISYTKLLTGETLARRTIEKLGLNMSADELRKKIKATAAPDTVLIDVTVRDQSRVLAREIANAMSDEFVTMVSELETPPGGERPDARVVVEQHAATPANPVIPKTKRNLAIGLALGALLGTALAVLRDRIDSTVKDQQTVEEITGAAVIANIPHDKERRTDPAISFSYERSAIAEAFRALRTNLQFLEVDDPPRVLVVTSSLAAEGKTTSSINIALALAEAEYNVVLVDGDMRRPKLHEYLDLIGSAGFSTTMTGRASILEVLQKTKFSGLTVMTSGVTPPNPSELLGSLAAKKILSQLRADFDYVIVDSSPLLAVTDAAVLAAAADGVLVISRFGKTKRDQLAHAVSNLRRVEARILGAVLTMIPARGHGSYGYYGEYKNSPQPAPRRKSGGRRRAKE